MPSSWHALPPHSCLTDFFIFCKSLLKSQLISGRPSQSSTLNYSNCHHLHPAPHLPNPILLPFVKIFYHLLSCKLASSYFYCIRSILPQNINSIRQGSFTTVVWPSLSAWNSVWPIKCYRMNKPSSYIHSVPEANDFIIQVYTFGSFQEREFVLTWSLIPILLYYLKIILWHINLWMETLGRFPTDVKVNHLWIISIRESEMWSHQLFRVKMLKCKYLCPHQNSYIKTSSPQWWY